MNEDSPQFALSCKDGNAPAPVLVGVQAQGRLDAVLFELTLRQTYRNTSSQVLEVVYTFPLPPMAVLLGFASELNGERQEGVIVAKREAERQYEESLEEGDAPVMLEAHDDGIHTANIGNLKPGDELVLECRFAQLLSFEQGRLRVSIPTTIAPRYGHAEQAGLQPQQVPLTSLDAEYPLALTLTLGEALAGATAECPTHRFATSLGQGGSIRMDLSPGARLDRDIVVIVTPRESRPSLLVRADDAFDASAPVVIMAALQPPLGAPRERIALKLLVDCSGSMNGDSIASARAALRGVVTGLSERDHLSLSRFGSTVEHLFAPSPAEPQALRHLQPLIDGIQADLGGTEMEGALSAVFSLPRSAEHGCADVLLITDGEIWQAEEMIPDGADPGHQREAFNIMLSMPRGTDPLAVQRAAREFAQAELADHKYVMVLHDHQANPHVHISVRAESKRGKRLNPRKGDLHRWRETFAEKLRGYGIEAEATRQFFNNYLGSADLASKFNRKVKSSISAGDVTKHLSGVIFLDDSSATAKDPKQINVEASFVWNKSAIHPLVGHPLDVELRRRGALDRS
jgi:hypothetical protein